MILQELLLLQPPLARLTLWLRGFSGDYQPRYYGSYSSDTATPTITLRPASVETSACEMLRKWWWGRGRSSSTGGLLGSSSAVLVDPIQVLEKHLTRNSSGSCSSPPPPLPSNFPPPSLLLSSYPSPPFPIVQSGRQYGVQLPLLDFWVLAGHLTVKELAPSSG